MAVFIITPLVADSSLLDKAIEEKIIDPSDRYRLQAERGWLISFNGTSIDLSGHIGLTGQGSQGIASLLGSAIIVPISSYYGRGPTDMWEWLKVKLENGR